MQPPSPEFESKQESRADLPPFFQEEFFTKALEHWIRWIISHVPRPRLPARGFFPWSFNYFFIWSVQLRSVVQFLSRISFHPETRIYPPLSMGEGEGGGDNG